MLSALASAGQVLGRKQQQQVLLPTPSASLLSTPLAASSTPSLPSPQSLTLLDPETLRLALQSPLPCSHWLLPFSLLHLSFFFVHYLFASQTAQVAAIYPAWCALMVKAGEEELSWRGRSGVGHWGRMELVSRGQGSRAYAGVKPLS